MQATLKFRQVLRVLRNGKLAPVEDYEFMRPTLVLALQQWHTFEQSDEESIPRIDFLDGGMWVDVPFVAA